MSNTELIRDLYPLFATGKVPAVSEHFHPAVEWHECPGMPFAKDSGRYTGPEVIVTRVFMNLLRYFDDFHITVSDMFGEGDRVCMEGYYEGTHKASSNVFKAQATHVWTLQNGKGVRFYQAVDTACLNR